MNAWLGFSLVVVGGIMQGTYFLGLKYVSPWKWENIWGLYALFALIVLPAGLAITTVPSLSEMFARTPGSAIAMIFLYGAGWGIGSVLAGLGVAKMGMAMGVSVLIGVTAAIGTFVPLVANSPELVFTPKGLLVILSVVVLLLGVSLAAIAGKKREVSLGGAPTQLEKGSFGAGLAICVFSGIFSAMLNMAFAFSQPMVKAGMETGASNFGALNAVWMVALTGGFIANAVYTGYLLTRNKTVKLCFPRNRLVLAYRPRHVRVVDRRGCSLRTGRCVDGADRGRRRLAAFHGHHHFCFHPMGFRERRVEGIRQSSQRVYGGRHGGPAGRLRPGGYCKSYVKENMHRNGVYWCYGSNKDNASKKCPAKRDTIP